MTTMMIEYSAEQKHEVKLIKEALRFVGLEFDTVTVHLFQKPGETIKCFWNVSFHNARDVEGSYYVLNAENTRLSIIMAVGMALYLQRQKEIENEDPKSH